MPAEPKTDAGLVRRLLAAQFPHWADLPLEPSLPTATDNAIYRLGDDMAVRLPRIRCAPPGRSRRSTDWLPQLAPRPPLAIPVPLAQGTPADGYPWHWSVCRWLEGENATIERIADLRPGRTAPRAVRRCPAADRSHRRASRPAPTTSSRRAAGDCDDAATRAAIDALGGMIDSGALTAAWDAALQAPAWQGPPVWIHGDLMPGNLLVQRGPARAPSSTSAASAWAIPPATCMPAWTLFSAETRDVFRAALAVDDATWARGRGWALSVALIALPYYQTTNPSSPASRAGPSTKSSPTPDA